jgi:hypothetical protein
VQLHIKAAAVHLFDQALKAALNLHHDCRGCQLFLQPGQAAVGSYLLIKGGALLNSPTSREWPGLQANYASAQTRPYVFVAGVFLWALQLGVCLMSEGKQLSRCYRHLAHCSRCPVCFVLCVWRLSGLPSADLISWCLHTVGITVLMSDCRVLLCPPPTLLV